MFEFLGDVWEDAWDSSFLLGLLVLVIYFLLGLAALFIAVMLLALAVFIFTLILIGCAAYGSVVGAVFGVINYVGALKEGLVG